MSEPGGAAADPPPYSQVCFPLLFHSGSRQAPLHLSVEAHLKEPFRFPRFRWILFSRVECGTVVRRDTVVPRTMGTRM